MELNGQPVPKSRWGRGDDGGWFLRGIDLKNFRGQEVKISAALANGSDRLFHENSIVSAWLVADRPIKAVPARNENLPYAISEQYRRQTTQLLLPTLVELAHQHRPVNEAELKSITAAKLRIVVYGLKDEPKIEKSIWLNGHQVACLPPNPIEKQINSRTYAAAMNLWQEVVIPLTPEQIPHIRLSNTVEVVQNSGQLFADMYKITGVALAVRLADGSWVRTKIDYAEICNTRHGWAHAFDGIKVFNGNARSGPIQLSF